MPLYEYVCKKCSHPFEELVFGDTVPRCPKCDTTSVEKVLSAHNVGRSSGPLPQLGGSGPCGGCPSSGSCGMN
jgi:putative FmdB family regulatory protein